jgi:hypothetical protein
MESKWGVRAGVALGWKVRFHWFEGEKPPVTRAGFREVEKREKSGRGSKRKKAAGPTAGGS